MAKPGRKRIRAEIRGEDPSGQAVIDYGPLDTVEACLAAIRAAVRAIGANRDPKFNHTRAIGGIKSIMWGMFQTKGLELKGLNMRDPDGEQVIFTSVDYRQPYQDAEARIKALEEENAALRELRGKDRPRPPRPNLN